MHIAFITVGDTARKVGGHLYNARLLAGLRERGVEMVEVVASAEGVEEQRAASSALGERLSPEEFDAIVVDALARVACAPHLDRWRETTPVIAMVHELPSIARADETEREFEEPLLRAERMICVSRHGASILGERGVSRDRIHVVSPGLERPAAPVAPAPDAPLLVLCVAQWIPRKDILGLVRAWRELRERSPDIEAMLELVGDTGADPAYSVQVREAVSGAEDIIVHGLVGEDDLRCLYSSASLFALPSLYEGYGMVYAEAMSHGLPVIALDSGPVPEVVGDAGILVEPGDFSGLVDALHDLLTNAGLRHRLSRRARSRSSELPGWRDTVDEFISVLEAAVSERVRI